ncbi:unnamed protein product, partial [Symbiodinium sp. CCMP2456]
PQVLDVLESVHSMESADPAPPGDDASSQGEKVDQEEKVHFSREDMDIAIAEAANAARAEEAVAMGARVGGLLEDVQGLLNRTARLSREVENLAADVSVALQGLAEMRQRMDRLELVNVKDTLKQVQQQLDNIEPMLGHLWDSRNPKTPPTPPSRNCDRSRSPARHPEDD